MTSFPHRMRALPAVVSCALFLVACSGSDPAAMLDSARQYMEKKDAAAAIIQLKNVLQEKPDTAEARYLLGKALMQTGNAAGGEAELQKALDLGYPADEIAPFLAKARLAQGQYKAVTDAFDGVTLGSPAGQAELKTLVAVAWRLQGNTGAFLASLDQALKAEPENAAARIEQALYKSSLKQFDEALAVLGDVLGKEPKQVDALKMRGDILLYGKQDPQGALESYRLAVQAQPGFRDGQGGVVRVLLSENRLDEAAKELEGLAKGAPGHPQTVYLQTQLAYQKQDFKQARELSQQLLKMVPENAAALELAGSIEYQLNGMNQAETLLSKALQLAPDSRIARRVLVLTHLRLGQVTKALSSLPADVDAVSDPALLEVAGQAYLANGDVDRAERLFTKASQLDPKDPAKRTSLAVSQLMSGKTEVAFGELRDIASTDSGVVADMALISALLKRKQVPQALAAIDVLSKKRPNDPFTWQLRGKTELMGNDPVGARKSLDSALAIDPNYFPAIAALSALDLTQKKPQEALKRLEEALKRKPDSAQVLLAVAEMRGINGAKAEEMEALMGKAIDAAPNEMAPRLALVDFHLRNRAEKRALSVAQAAATALPDSQPLLDALGRAQLANGEHNQALSTFGKLSRLQPQSPLPLLRMAMVQSAAKDPAAAEASLRKALALQPDLLAAQKGLAGMALQDKRMPEALAIGRTVQKQRPKEAAGYMLEGDVHAASGNWAAAAQAYKTGYKLEPVSELAIKLHSALDRAGNKGEADRLATDFTKSHPEHPAFSLYLGDRAMAGNDWKVAREHYLKVIAQQPDNALALNNLAWTSGQLGLKDAVGYAEKANALVPDQPAFIDTLAMLLSQNGEHARATELQKQVVAKQANVPVFKLNLAKILIQAGDKTSAKPLLEELQAQGAGTALKAEVDALIQAL